MLILSCSKFVPLFLSPAIAQLPLTFGELPPMTVLKYLFLIIVGTIASVISTGLAANALVSTTHRSHQSIEERTTGVMRLNGGAPNARTPSTPPGRVKMQKCGTDPILKMAVVGMFVFAGK